MSATHHHIANMPSLADLRAMPLGTIAALPAEQLAILQADADAALASAKNLKDWLDGAIARRYAELAAAARRAQGKDSGTVRLMDGEVTVVADLPKRVDWDQQQLGALTQRIRETGNDPAEYVDIAFKVPERKYAAWPAHIRIAFEAARTVRTGKESFTLKPAPDG